MARDGPRQGPNGRNIAPNSGFLCRVCDSSTPNRLKKPKWGTLDQKEGSTIRSNRGRSKLENANFVRQRGRTIFFVDSEG